MKRMTVVIRQSPFNRVAAAEGLRMAVGLLLADNIIRLILLEDGVYLLGALQPEIIEGPDIARHLRTLVEFGAEVIVERQALAQRGLRTTMDELLLREGDEIAALLAGCDYAIVI